MGIIFDIKPTGRKLFSPFTRVQVGIGEKEENKLGVYLSKRQYKRWVRGLDLSKKRDKRVLERWLGRWKRMGYISSNTSLEDIPARITPADWNPVLTR